MKAKNINNASKKTQNAIKRVFAEMLSEKKELGNLSVTELCERADISRGAFYSHYDDIYGVAEDYENELIDNFFDNAKLIGNDNCEQFIDTFFEYIRKNENNYRLLCKSNDCLFTAKKLADIASGKILELCHRDPRFKNREYMEIDIHIFIDGLLCEYIKVCRGLSTVTSKDLYAYTKRWVNGFIRSRSEPKSERTNL